MANAAGAIPQEMHTITPHLTVDGVARYIDFLQRAFDATELMRAPGPNGKIIHATVCIGDSILMLTDHFPELGMPPIAEGFWPMILNLHVPDADATFERATAADCEASMPLADQYWGSRYGEVQDPFGFRWAVETHKEDLAFEQVKQRQDTLFAKLQTQ